MIKCSVFTLPFFLIFSFFYPDNINLKHANRFLHENLNVKSDTSNFAILFVYRPKTFGFGGPTYDMYVDDSEMSGKLFIEKIKGNFYREIKIYKEGEYTFWAKTLEEKVSVTVDIKFGKSYYLRCGFSQGVIRNRPKLEFVDEQIGEKEFKNK